MVSHHPAMFGGHIHCGSGDMFLMVEEQDSTCSSLYPPLLFLSKRYGLKAHGKSDPGHAYLKQQKRMATQLFVLHANAKEHHSVTEYKTCTSTLFCKYKRILRSI